MKFAFFRATRTRWLPIASVALLCIFASAPSAPAEDGGGLPGFLSHLFGAPAAKPPEPAPTAAVHRVHKKVRDFVPATATRAPGTPGGDPVQANFFIDVLGDSLAVLAAQGLTDAFVDRPEVAIANKAREASGLVRDNYYDWPKAAAELATGKDKIDFVVVMIGINDVQPLKDGANTLEPFSDGWRAQYAQRVESLVAPFKAAHISVTWVGLPPMRTDRLNDDVIKLNEIFKEHAEKAGAKFVDIWDAFADQTGAYDAFGPNVDGQNVKLRGVDGIHFTKAGARKVAHFLEAEIHRALEKGKPQNEVATLPPDIEQAADDINAQIRREMGAPAPAGEVPEAHPKSLAGPIQSLSSRPLSPSGALAAHESRSPGETDEIARVLRIGEPVSPVAGRADDFPQSRL